ncbi:hypothetical protein [Paraburkholderia sp. J63]|uniref:hypothetical protein n=1 Tax=Paraburkholderia sp. J63 TaxID=2805434 RepID=UPI002ABE21A4|nr:hypothetical protein [Paraburkholderia sp. J63]
MFPDAVAGGYFYSMPITPRLGSTSTSSLASLLAPDGTLSDAALADYCSGELRRMARDINQNAQASTNDTPTNDGDGSGGSGSAGDGSGGGAGNGGGDATNLKLQTLVSNYQATVTRFSTMLASHGETKKSVANNTK